jgi:putative FmdB family regulatory protein
LAAYEYRCRDCGEQQTVTVQISEFSDKITPLCCKQPMKRLYNGRCVIRVPNPRARTGPGAPPDRREVYRV